MKKHFACILVFAMVPRVFAGEPPEEFRVAKSAFQDGLYQIAGNQFLSFIKNRPESEKIPEASFFLAECLLNLEKFGKAREAYSRAAESPGFAEASIYRTSCTYLVEEKYEDSIGHFREYLDKFPEGKFKQPALFRLGECLLETGRNKEAGEAFLQAAEAAPGSSLGRKSDFAAGTAFLKSGEFEKAETAFLRFLESGPGGKTEPGALYRLGLSRLQTAGGEEAGKIFKRVFTEFPGSPEADDALFTAGINCFRLGDHNRAAELLGTFIEGGGRGRRAGHARLKLASALETLGRAEEAAAVYEQAARAAEAETRRLALYRHGRLMLEEGDAGRASKIFNKLEESYPGSAESALGRMLESATLYANAEYARAAEAAENTAAPDGLAPELNFMAAAAFFMLGEYEKAGELFESPHAHGERWHRPADRLFYSAVCLLKNEEPGAAREKMEKFISLFPENSFLLYAFMTAGEASFALAEYRRAAEFFKKAAMGTEDSLSDTALFRKGDALRAGGYLPEAAAAYGKTGGAHTAAARLREAETFYLMERFDESADAAAIAEPFSARSARHRKYMLGAALARAGDAYGAEREFAKFMEQFPDSGQAPAALFSLGAVLFRQKRFEAALPHFEKTIQLFPDEPEAREAKFFAAICLLEAGKEGAASQKLGEYLADPEALRPEEASLRLGRINFEKGRYGEAGALLGPLAESGNKKVKPAALYLLGKLLKKEKDFTGASELLEKALELEEDEAGSMEILLRLAGAFRQSKENEKALETYMRIRLATPGPEMLREAEYYSAGILMSQGRHEDAIRTYDKIKRPLPEAMEADIHLRKAGCLRETGDYEEALLGYLRTAYLFPSQQNTALDALESAAGILLMLERPAEASKIYLKITELDPEGIKGEVASQKLKSLNE